MANNHCPNGKFVKQAKGKYLCPILNRNVPVKNGRCMESSCSKKR